MYFFWRFPPTWKPVSKTSHPINKRFYQAHRNWQDRQAEKAVPQFPLLSPTLPAAAGEEEEKEIDGRPG
jgi:hypothetical protein